MASNLFKGFIKGDTIPVDVELKIAGVPENITGAKIFVTLKTEAQLGQPDAGAVLQVEHDVVAGPDATAGKARVILPSDKTNAVAPGKYWMDVQRVFAGAPPDVWTFFRQQIEVLQQVTEDNA